MLHTLSRSPWQCDIDTLLSMLREGDDLLLIQDGVLAALEGSRFVEILANAPITVSALKRIWMRGVFLVKFQPKLTWLAILISSILL